jgi:hypothetical protein
MTERQRQLVRSHGVLGYEVGRVPAPDNPEHTLVVVQTRSHLAGESLKTVPAHMTREASTEDAITAIRAQLAAIIEQALFFDLAPEDIERAFRGELEHGAK